MVTQAQVKNLHHRRAWLTDNMTAAKHRFQEFKKEYLVEMEEFRAKRRAFLEESATVPVDAPNDSVQRTYAHLEESERRERRLAFLSDSAEDERQRAECYGREIMDLTEQIAKLKEKME